MLAVPFTRFRFSRFMDRMETRKGVFKKSAKSGVLINGEFFTLTQVQSPKKGAKSLP